MGNNSDKNCPFADEIVSYMYDEMAVAERPKFEEHLVDCQVCTDDFAVVSLARFEAYDWKRAEFDPLRTPLMVIPYEEKAISIGERFSAWLAWTKALPIAAGLILVLGIAYLFVLRTERSNEPMVAEAPVAEQQKKDITQPVDFPRLEPPVTTAAVNKTSNSNANVHLAIQKRKPAAPKALLASRLAPGVRPNNDLAVNIPSQTRPLPRLSVNDDEVDSSLRLADLFDETKPPPER
jgi:hypothetical protein